MKTSDTSIFVGLNCTVCGKRVHVSKGTGYWRFDPTTGSVQAWHTTCKLYGFRP